MIICAEHVDFQVNRKSLLKDVSFLAKPYAITGLIGPNGAGKTTLLKLLAGLIRPTSGHIKIDNENIASMKANMRARLLAYMPQANSVHWPVSVQYIVGMGRLPFRKSSAGFSGDNTQIVQNAMAQMAVDQLANRDVTSLSGGEKARVLLARALAQTTRILLVDEPATGLDIGHQISLMEKFQSLAASGITVILVLHDLSQAARYCHHVVLLDQGHLVCEGTPLEVLTKPRILDVYGVEADISEIADCRIITPLALAQRGDGA